MHEVGPLRLDDGAELAHTSERERRLRRSHHLHALGVLEERTVSGLAHDCERQFRDLSERAHQPARVAADARPVRHATVEKDTGVVGRRGHEAMIPEAPGPFASTPAHASSSIRGMATEGESRIEGVNLIGHLSSNTGLGVAARNTLRMLLANEVPVSVVDIDPGGGGIDASFATLPGLSTTPDKPVNLLHLNPDRLRYLISPFQRTIDFENKLNVAVPFWEAPRLPRHWLRTLAAMDVILAPTLFVRDAVLADLPEATVVHYPQTVFLPDGIEPDRARFGLEENEVVFSASFALASDVERKNPWAVIEAFKRAFGGAAGYRLAIKTTGGSEAGRSAPSNASEAPRRRLPGSH